MSGRIAVWLMVGALVTAGAASRALALDESFVDVDNDGVWSNGDLPLAPFLDPDGYGFDARTAQPGWQPRTHPVGVVVQGQTTFTGEITDITATGNIIVRGDVKAKGRDRWVKLQTVGGDITIEPGTRVRGSGDVDFQALDGGSITVGANARLQTKGDQAELAFEADHDLTVESGAQLKIGGGYPWISLHAHDALRLQPGVSVRGSSHCALDLLSDTDLDLIDVYAKLGYLRIEAYSTDRHPEARRIHIADSVLSQTYRNGDFRLVAHPALGTTRYATDAVVIERSLVLTKEDLPLFLPEPIWQ
jgi:hypothetical protein